MLTVSLDSFDPGAMCRSPIPGVGNTPVIVNLALENQDELPTLG